MLNTSIIERMSSTPSPTPAAGAIRYISARNTELVEAIEASRHALLDRQFAAPPPSGGSI
jgi:hypothetical protein